MAKVSAPLTSQMASAAKNSKLSAILGSWTTLARIQSLLIRAELAARRNLGEVSDSRRPRFSSALRENDRRNRSPLFVRLQIVECPLVARAAFESVQLQFAAHKLAGQ